MDEWQPATSQNVYLSFTYRNIMKCSSTVSVLLRSQFKMSTITSSSQKKTCSVWYWQMWTCLVHQLCYRPTWWKYEPLFGKQCLTLQWHPDPNEFLLTQHVQSRAAFINATTFDLAPWPLNSPSVLSARWQVGERIACHILHTHTFTWYVSAHGQTYPHL